MLLTMQQSKQLTLSPTDNRRLADLCGQYDEHLKQLEQQLKVKIHHRGNTFKIDGHAQAISTTEEILLRLYAMTKMTDTSETLSPKKVHLVLQEYQKSNMTQSAHKSSSTDAPGIPTKKGLIKAHSKNQQIYLDRIQQHDINFGIGPAGTGKTYLAVACAVAALNAAEVKRLVLVRPAVEAGERLGFLPGDLAQKVDPYLRPLYDALYEMLGFEQVNKLLEHNTIEIAPLAYMRGRTLNEAFIILDEGQNTTKEQMKMFLTRIGFGSKAVITGDVSQVDLPKGTASGMQHAVGILQEIKGISFTRFAAHDVVRHALVQDIVRAYDQHENSSKTEQ
jgi:phosphate starvation-inducible PhoH-like protein